MKSINLFVCLFIIAFVLSGCNDSSKSVSPETTLGVYTGVNKDKLGNLAQVQITLESGRSPLVSFWDDRDHQTSFLGKRINSNELDFNAVQYKCNLHSSTVECESPEGKVALQKQMLPTVKLATYAGNYQVNWNKSLYIMSVDNQGNISISNQTCTAKGMLSVSNDVDNLITINIDKDDCSSSVVHGYAEFILDNKNLHSINVQTDNAEFPQVWVKL